MTTKILVLEYPVQVKDDDWRGNDVLKWSTWFFQTNIDYTNLDIVAVKNKENPNETDS